MKKKLLFIAFFVAVLNGFAQNNPAPQSRGITTPFIELDTLTTAQRDAMIIRGNKRRVIYHKSDTVSQLEWWNGTTWQALGGAIDLTANYTWTGVHSFDNPITYFGNNVKISTQPSVEVKFGNAATSLLYNELEFRTNASNRIGIVTNPNTSGNFDLYTPILTANDTIVTKNDLSGFAYTGDNLSDFNNDLNSLKYLNLTTSDFETFVDTLGNAMYAVHQENGGYNWPLNANGDAIVFNYVNSGFALFRNNTSDKFYLNSWQGSNFKGWEAIATEPWVNSQTSGSGNPYTSNIYYIDELSDLQGDLSAENGKMWMLTTNIDAANATLDLSAYDFMLASINNGKVTNFNSVNLGDFRTEGNPNATYFDQSGTITGECLDANVYLKWFSPHNNAHLINGENVNGALSDHVAFQNLHRIARDSEGNYNANIQYFNGFCMQGDGTNPDYAEGNTGIYQPYVPYTGGIAYTNGSVVATTTFPIDGIISGSINGVEVGANVYGDGVVDGTTVVSYSAPNLELSVAQTLEDDVKLTISGQYPYNVNPETNGEIGVMQGFEFGSRAGGLDPTIESETNRKRGPKIYGNGMRIIAHPGQAQTEDNKGFEFSALKDIYIENLEYDGNNIHRDPKWILRSTIGRQKGFNFINCKDPVIFNVESNNSVSDGFAFGGSAVNPGPIRFSGSGGKISFSRASGSCRAGIALVNHTNLEITNNIFENTGQNISLVDGHFLADSPNVNVIGEQGVLSTDGKNRGQTRTILKNNTIRNGLGGNLLVHWGSYDWEVHNNFFDDGDILNPADAEGLTVNLSFKDNELKNSGFESNGGGVHVENNHLFYDKMKLEGLIPDNSGGMEQRVVNAQAILVQDLKNNYLSGRDPLDTSILKLRGAGAAVIENNTIEVDADNDNLPLTGVTLGRITVNHPEAIVNGNTFINALAIQSSGSNGTLASVGTASSIKSVDNNVWHITQEALDKYTGNIGKLQIDRTVDSYDGNTVHDGYSSGSGIDVHSNMPKPDVRGSIVKFSSLGGSIDGDEAFEIHVPNVSALFKVSIVNSTGQGVGKTETIFDTSNPTWRDGNENFGAAEAGWYFSDPQAGTNPKSGNASYMVAARHDTAGNSNLETSIVVEWYGQDGVTYSSKEFYIERNTTAIPAGTFRKVYTGGKTGTTAQRPTTGGLNNYTEIKTGAPYYDTTVGDMLHWDGSSFN